MASGNERFRYLTGAENRTHAPCGGADGSKIRPRRMRSGTEERKREKRTKMTRRDIINKRIPHAFFGYDVAEVDLFLDEVIRELDRIHNELEIASLTADAAKKREEGLKSRIEELTKELERMKG